MTPFVPHGAYVLRLAARADAALGSVEGVWPGGIPVELRDRAGLFHTARHVAYCAHTAAPDDEEMTLYMSLVAGLPERYGVPDWRARRTLDRIAEWVREAEHAEYVERKAQVASWHASMVFNCARHEVRLAATQVLTERGRTAAEIAAHLGCTVRHVRRLLEASGAPREKRPRWTAEEIEVLRNGMRRRGARSERAVCFEIAKTLGRNPKTVHTYWKRLKRQQAPDDTSAHTGAESQREA